MIRTGVAPLGFHSSADVWAIAAASFLRSTFGLAEVVTSRCAANARETLDRYSHLVDGMDRDAAEVVSALIQ